MGSAVETAGAVVLTADAEGVALGGVSGADEADGDALGASSETTGV